MSEAHVTIILPGMLAELRLRENFHGRWYDIHFVDGHLQVRLAKDGLGPTTVVVAGREYAIEPGGTIEVDL